MLSHQLGFISSWKMLTRDKGWIKPLLLLALVSWIPIIGQIAILGFGLEWARLTAWGVDAAPKQRGIDFAKMITTGGIAVLISVIVNVVFGGIGFFIFRGVFKNIITTSGVRDILTQGMLSTVTGVFFDGGLGLAIFAILFVVNLFIQALVLAAQLRSTLYDGFGAGWRFDRLLQMVVRDAGGFVHECLILALWGIVAAVLDKVVSTCADAGMMMLGMMGMTLGMYGSQALSLVGTSFIPVLLVALIALVVLFAFQVIKVALQLVAINAMGQWFQRFDVGRWGVSSAPLPDGVPVRESRAGKAEDSPEGTGQAASADASVGESNAGTEGNGTTPREPQGEVVQDPVEQDGNQPITQGVEERKPILLGPISDVEGDGSTEASETAEGFEDETTQ